MRILKLSLLALLGLTAILILTVVAITATIDPNDYKADIETIVAKNTTLKLSINGDLGWSFLPLGVDINNVTLEHLDGKPFTNLNQLTAQVGLISLLKFNPQVHKIIIDGLEVTLEKNENGEASWENITPKNDVVSNSQTPTHTKPSSDYPEKETTKSTTSKAVEEKTLQLEIEEIAITNTTIRYIDKQSNQSASLENFNLLANNISFGNEFPIIIDFQISNSAPKLDIKANISASITIDSMIKHFTVRQLQSSYKLSGAPFQGKEVSASFNGNSIIADLNKDTISLDKIALEFANFALNTDLVVNSLSKQPQLNGAIIIPNFSLQALLSSLGQSAIETTDNAVLKKIGLSTKVSGNADTIMLNNLAILLDDTQYTGSLNYRSEGQFVAANIKGTVLNVDRYLPPSKDPVTQTAQAIDNATVKETAGTPAPATSSQPEAQLLPLDTIRALNLDISFIQQKLIAKNLTLNDLTLLLKAENGIVSLTEASGKLYEGSFHVNANIDATSGNPKWKISKKVNNIQVMPLLKDLQDLEIISGGVNLNADIITEGNTISALRSGAKGNANFDFDKGAFHGFNLTKLTCEGVALVNQDKVTKSDWTDKSEFQAMKGSLKINGNQFTNNNLTAAMSGLALVGQGVIDTASADINYGIDLKAIGDLGDNACRVNDKVKDLAIPVLCKGSLSEDPAKLCRLDKARVQELVVAAGKKELKRKADKEVKKQLDKYLGDEESETKSSVKKLIKGLF